MLDSDDISSLDSVISHHIDDNNNLHHQNQHQNQNQFHQTNNIITRTSTIISHIKDDNKFAKTQVEPNPSFDPYDIKKVGTAALIDWNKNEDGPNDNDNCLDTTNNNTDLEKSEMDDDTITTTKSNAVQDTGEYNIFDLENKPPDGGFWAWTAAVCVMLINTFSWGSNATFGVFLNYYTTLNYFPGASMEQYVMIGGLGLGLSFMACAVTNALCRKFHYKILMSIGTAIIFLSYWTASVSKNVIQLIMLQGFLMSIGYALAAGTSFLILPTWFLKKRSIAQGIATAGGGLGGIIFSRPVDEIIKSFMNNPKYANDPHEGVKMGISWALRMLGLVCGFMLIIAITFLRTYRPIIDPNAKDKSLRKELFAFLFRFDLLKQIPMICLILWNMVYGLAYTILLFSLSSYATSIGLSYKQGSNITTVQSVAQTIGRPILGIISESIGRVNTTIFFTFVLAILTFCFWIFVTTYSQLLAFGFLAGFILGVNWVNFGPMTADVVGGGGADLNHAISLQMFTGGFPLLIAELVGLKLKKSDMSRPFLYCQILVGVSALVSAILLLPFREWKIKRILLARRKLFQTQIDQHDGNNADYEKEEDKLQNTAHDIENDEEIKRLDGMLENTLFAYLIRMLYPIAV